MKYGCLILFFVVSLMANGQNLIYDNSFPPGAGASGGVHQLLSLPDGRIVLGGEFQSFGGVTGRGLVRLWPNGQRDTNFTIGTGVTTRVQELAVGPNGRLYVGGLFSAYAGTTTGNIVCLDSTGAIDPTFAAAAGFNNEITALAAFPNGDIVVAGFFTQYKGLPVTQPVKILANGQRDLTFNSGGTGSTGIIDVIYIQPDQKILVGGSVNNYNGQTASRLIRLNPDGSRDSTFDLNLTISGPIIDMDLMPDGRIIIGGTFTSINGVGMVRIASLLPNGQLDPTFIPGTGFNSTVRTVGHGFEGQILVGGDFTSFNGQSTSRIAILDSSGNLQYVSGSCAATNGTVFALHENPDQSLTIGGVFTQIGGVSVGRIARLLRGGLAGQASAPVITAANLTSCAGHAVTLMITAGSLNSASEWRWYTGGCGGVSFSSNNIIMVYPTVTTTYYARGEGGCVANGPCDSVTIVVQDSIAPVPLIWNLPVIVGQCGLTIPTPFASDNCMGAIPGIPDRSTTFTEPGQFNVLWTYTDSVGLSISQTQRVIVDSVDTRIVHDANSNTLTALNASASYQWVRCDLGYLPITNATSGTHQISASGDYAVILNQNGCIDTSVCLSLVISGLAEDALSKVQLYPNPAHNEVTVVTATPLELRLFDTQGRLVFTLPLEEFRSQIQLPNLPKGLYYWEMKRDGIVGYRKQLIE